MNIEKIWERFQKGDPITTPEMRALRDRLKVLEKGLVELGPEFRMPFREILHNRMRCDDFLASRASRGK